MVREEQHTNEFKDGYEGVPKAEEEERPDPVGTIPSTAIFNDATLSGFNSSKTPYSQRSVNRVYHKGNLVAAFEIIGPLMNGGINSDMTIFFMVKNSFGVLLINIDQFNRWGVGAE